MIMTKNDDDDGTDDRSPYRYDKQAELIMKFSSLSPLALVAPKFFKLYK